jgi:hypothetical protein
MAIRKERTFYGATQAETEALAEEFAKSMQGSIFFSAPVLAQPLDRDDHKRPPKWQVDVQYQVEDCPPNDRC